MDTRSIRCVLAWCGAMIAAVASPTFAQTLVVDRNGGGGAFTTVQAAVDAAPSRGALILVRPGEYAEHVLIDGKAVTILGTGPRPGDVLLRGTNLVRPVVRVRNHPTGARTTLASVAIGKDLFPGFPFDSTAIDVQGGRGELLFDAVESIRRWRIRSFRGRVSIARSRGRSPDDGTAQPEPGLLLDRVDVAVVESSSFVGGRGAGAATVPAGKGAPGLYAIATRLEVSRCELVGGVGGFVGLPATLGGAGGSGLRVEDEPCRVSGPGSVTGGDAMFVVIGTQPAAGEGGVVRRTRLEHSTTSFAGGALPSPGVAFDVGVSASRVVSSPIVATFERQGDWRVGQTTTLAVDGPAGHVGAALVGFDVGLVDYPFGPLLIGTVETGIPFTLDAAGQASIAETVPNDPVLAGEPIYVQSMTADPTTFDIVLGGSSVGVVLP